MGGGGAAAPRGRAVAAAAVSILTNLAATGLTCGGAGGGRGLQGLGAAVRAQLGPSLLPPPAPVPPPRSTKLARGPGRQTALVWALPLLLAPTRVVIKVVEMRGRSLLMRAVRDADFETGWRVQSLLVEMEVSRLVPGLLEEEDVGGAVTVV